MTDRRESGNASIDVVQTVPSQITMHTIEDHQLDKLTNISRPISLALAGLTGGAFFSFLPAAFSSYDRLNTTQFGKIDLFYIVSTAVAGIGMIGLGYYAGRGEYDARKLVESIRARQRRPF